MKNYLEVLQNYAVFKGRATRTEYWSFILINAIISWVLGMIDSSQIGYSIYSLAVLIPTLAVAVRRMHDVGKSGWYLLIPIYNFILAVSIGDSGDNEYGVSTLYDENGELID